MMAILTQYQSDQDEDHIMHLYLPLHPSYLPYVTNTPNVWVFCFYFSSEDLA